MPAPLIELAMRKLPNAEFIQAYGMTEASPQGGIVLLNHQAHCGETSPPRGAPAWVSKCASSISKTATYPWAKAAT